MKNTHTLSHKATASVNNEQLKEQIAEAFHLIRQLQQSNAELIRQNAHLMRHNSRLMLTNGHQFLSNDNKPPLTDSNSFMNDILSLINDSNPAQIDQYPKVNENKLSTNDNKSTANDNNVSINENNLVANDNNPKVNEHNSSVIEINGKKFDKTTLLQKLRFKYNICGKQNYSDEELIEHVKLSALKTIEYNKAHLDEKTHKVPALFFFFNHESQSEDICENTFRPLLYAYKQLKRNRKNAPALKRQVIMLLWLYRNEGSKPQELFAAAGITSITGFRYAAKLRKHGFLKAVGRGTGGYYSITNEGKKFLETNSTTDFI